MDLNEVILGRRSIRKFTDEPVPEMSLDRILEAGRWAPSASNIQPWRFVVIANKNVKEKLAAVFTEFSRKAWAEFSSERTRYLGLRGGTWDKSKMATIPILIAVCYEPQREMREELILGSVWAAIENMLLAATSHGLGSCIYTFYNGEEEEQVKTILRVPKRNRIAAVIQLGSAATRPPAPSRKALEEIVSYEHF